MVRRWVLGGPGDRVILMGNEAIARGAIEAGVGFATGYPGTPSSEVLEVLIEASTVLGFYAEWAVNEKVALEMCLGASMTGVRSIVTMKAPGVNVASDPLVSAGYSGVNGGMVVLVADDPGPHTTQTEQDSRWYGKIAKLPIIEPSDPQEAKEYARLAFEISEKYMLPIILRTTTRVNHSSGDVILGGILRLDRRPSLRREAERFIRASMEWNLKRHEWVESQLDLLENSRYSRLLNRALEGEDRIGIIASGAPYNYVVEAVERLKVSPYILKVGMVNPLSEEVILDFAREVRKILVVEEVDPYIEVHVRGMLQKAGMEIEVHGKDLLPRVGELTPKIVESAIASLYGNKMASSGIKVGGELPRRPPTLCPGCPHRASFYALKKAMMLEGVKLSDAPVFGDIGCYALSLNPPLETIWTEHAMGSSISMAAGAKLAGYEGPVFAVIGDSTFYHSGIQPLIEAAHKNVDLIVIILDNGTTAMTGHQPTPAVDRLKSGRVGIPIMIENIVEAAKPRMLKIVDPLDVNRTVEALREAIRESGGLRVLILRSPCALTVKPKPPYRVHTGKCTGCMACIKTLGCPAVNPEDGRVKIVENLCNGCGLCAEVCPYGAIER